MSWAVLKSFDKPHCQSQQIVEILLVYAAKRLLAALPETPFQYFIFYHLVPV